MKKFLLLAVFALVVGCSSPVSVDYHVCETIGAVDDISVDYGQNFISVRDFKSIATTGDIYFYLNENVFYYNGSQLIVHIPDSSLFVMGKAFDGLSAMITQDAYDRWYMQIIRNESNLCMSVGGEVEIKSFTARW